MKLKLILAVVSFLATAILFDWLLALILLTNIYIHEQGHIWAIKQVGHETSGFYFLPLLGGVTLSTGKFTNRPKRIFVFLMGPFFGLLLGVATLGLYFATSRLIFVFLSGIAAVINLFNLIPIKPLDGGYIFDDLVSDRNPQASYNAQYVINVAALFAVAWLGLFLLVILIGYKLLTLGVEEEAMPTMNKTQRRVYTYSYLGTVVVLGWLCRYSFYELEPVIREALAQTK